MDGFWCIFPKPEAHGSSSLWLSKARPASKWLHPLTLGDMKDGEEALGQFTVKMCFRNTRIIQLSFNRPHYIFQMHKAVLMLAQRLRDHWSSNNRFPFYRARELFCVIRRGKRIPECRWVHAQRLCNHHVQIREFLYILVIRDHLKGQDKRNNYVFSHASAKHISD